MDRLSLFGLQGHIFPRPKTAKPPSSVPKNPFPALDGIRGLASVIVLIFHAAAAYSPTVFYGYGSGTGNYWPHQLPILRLIFAGPAMVLLFYIISGYLLSYKPLKLARSGRWDKAFHALSSSIFRRGLRLFLPVLASTFITMTLLYAGLFQYISKKSTSNLGFRLSKFEIQLERLDTFPAQLQHWWLWSCKLMNPFTWERQLTPYNPNLWTIPFEFRNSLILSLVILSLARLKSLLRLMIVSWLVWIFAWYGKWPVATCLSGCVLAELDLQFGRSNRSEGESSSRKESEENWKSRAKEAIIFATGLYLASYPRMDGDKTPGYRNLSEFVPARLEEDKDKLWQSLGCWIIIYAIINFPSIGSLFTGPFIQYLGGLSFTIYLIHAPVLNSLGLLAMSFSRKYTGMDTAQEKVLSFVFSAAIVLPGLLWLAEVFKTLVEVPCARLCKLLEKLCTSNVASEGPADG